jgi:hypothetical protein
LPSAVRTDFGKCAIVRFLFAADTAFFMFFFAAFLCFIEAIFHTPLICSRIVTVFMLAIYAALSATVVRPALRAQLAQQ